MKPYKGKARRAHGGTYKAGDIVEVLSKAVPAEWGIRRGDWMPGNLLSVSEDDKIPNSPSVYTVRVIGVIEGWRRYDVREWEVKLSPMSLRRLPAYPRIRNGWMIQSFERSKKKGRWRLDPLSISKRRDKNFIHNLEWCINQIKSARNRNIFLPGLEYRIYHYQTDDIILEAAL